MSKESMTIEELQKAVSEQDAEAMFELGKRTIAGDGVEKDAEKGRDLLSSAAEAGDVAAAEYLADLFKDSKDPNAPVYINRYYRKAIAGGSVTAIDKLGRFHYLGDGGSYRHAFILFAEYVKRMDGEDCDKELEFMDRMIQSNWVEGNFSAFTDCLEVMTDNGNRTARRLLLSDDLPEASEQFDFDAIVAEDFPLPEKAAAEEKPSDEPEEPRWRFHVGKERGRRDLKTVLNSMCIEAKLVRRGTYRTAKGKEIEEQIARLAEMGYDITYDFRYDKWTIKEKAASSR
ncbi:MAG: hypothetical protein MJZ38_07375 [archaeon]|nr:hypothetical protein [archaeon]